MLNKFPLWKNLLLIGILIVAAIYSSPNLFGADPSVQISGNTSQAVVNAALQNQITEALTHNKLVYKSTELSEGNLLIRFRNTDEQLQALSVIRGIAGTQYTAAINLAPATPRWLQAINAKPMKKGLDLQGGIHFLLDVDVPNAISKRIDGTMRGLSDDLRHARIRYESISKSNDSIIITFKDADSNDKAYSTLATDYPNLMLSKQEKNGNYQITATFSPPFIQQIKDYTLDQTLTTLRNRVNELGISEPLVQQQGLTRISVDLPGVQDSAQARQILGGTATLEFRLVDSAHDINSVISSGITPPGTRIYHIAETGQPILLQNQIVLSGDSITNAQASFGEDGRPNVSITLGGGGESFFYKITHDNIGNRMAIVYVETKTENKMVNGQSTKVRSRTERVISAPVIQSALPAQFQITGLSDPKEARNLALLLRAGAMPVNVDIVEERTVGASAGQENIRQGVLSVEVGAIIIVVFMALYYSVFGLIADIALVLNLLLIVAVLSVLGATLTLPGIAGIVLTVGMAVDANVLIFERIREELRNGTPPQSSIHAGFERAFGTIVDANITTLIVAIVLFGIGSGPIKGFAVTLTVGILTSMFTAITFTRGIVNFIYGGKIGKKLRIGIRYGSVITSSAPSKKFFNMMSG